MNKLTQTAWLGRTYEGMHHKQTFGRSNTLVLGRYTPVNTLSVCVCVCVCVCVSRWVASGVVVEGATGASSHSQWMGQFKEGQG